MAKAKVIARHMFYYVGSGAAYVIIVGTPETAQYTVTATAVAEDWEVIIPEVPEDVALYEDWEPGD